MYKNCAHKKVMWCESASRCNGQPKRKQRTFWRFQLMKNVKKRKLLYVVKTRREKATVCLLSWNTRKLLRKFVFLNLPNGLKALKLPLLYWKRLRKNRLNFIHNAKRFRLNISKCGKWRWNQLICFGQTEVQIDWLIAKNVDAERGNMKNASARICSRVLDRNR